MRHRRAGRKLNRNINQRKALFKNLISALILQGKIRTTEAKAKAVKGLVDKLIRRAKQGTLAARRLVAAFLQDKKVVNKLVDEVAPKLKQRPGGFTSLARIERRRGDNAVIMEVELLDQTTQVTVEAVKPTKLKKANKPKKIVKRKTAVKLGVRQESIKVKPQIRTAIRSQAAIQKRGTGK